MDEPVIHSESWTGPPQPPTPDWYWRIFPRAMTKLEVRAARADARKMAGSRTTGIVASLAWLVGGGLLHFSTRLSGWMIPAIPIDVPPIWLLSFTSIFGVVLFIRAASRDLSPMVIRTSSLFGAILFVFALLLPTLTIYSYVHSEGGPKRRMQFVSSNQGDAEGAIFAFGDGSSVETPYFWRSQLNIHRTGECFSVRQYKGPFGFSWIKVLETTPRPVNSELWWQIRREDCFSNKPLSSLGH
jgi:hypothetical protein